MIGIWYFSASGNGKKLSEKIASELSDTEIDLIDITPYGVREQISKSITYNQLIIIYPIYAGDTPCILKDFFDTLDGNGITTVLIALWGNVHSSNALYNLKSILKTKNFKVVAGVEVVASHSYNNDKIKLGYNRPINREITQLVEFLKKVLRKTDDSIEFPRVRRTFLMLLPQGFIQRKMVRMDFDYVKCTNCKLCQTKCPVNAIKDDGGIDDHKCIRCLACVNICKRQARKNSFTNERAQKHLLKFQNIQNECKFYYIKE